MKFLLPLALLGLCAAVPVPAPAVSSDISQALKIHNNARAAVGHAPLVWDTKLASDAASWAQYLVTQGSMIHSGGSNGENLFQGWKDGSFAAAATMWAAEKSQYHGEVVPTDPNSNNFERWGHYTQVIWPKTTKVGMGIARGSDGRSWVVGRYSPAGNIEGQTAF